MPVVLCAVVPVCVCTWSHTFLAHREAECHVPLRTVQRVPSLRVWHTVTPSAPTPEPELESLRFVGSRHAVLRVPRFPWG